MMSWAVDKDNPKKITYLVEESVISVQFCGGGLKIEVREVQEDKEELLMYKKFIGSRELGLSFVK